MFDFLPLLKDPIMLIILAMISFLPVIFIGVFVGGSMAVQSLVGAIVLTLFFAGIQIAQSTYFNKHWFRFQDIYVASPVSPLSYAMGLSISTLIGSVPSVVIAMGILLFTWSVTPAGFIFLAIVSGLLWLSTIFMGFMIGSSVKDTRRANTLPQALGFLFGFLPPIYYPLDKLPGFIQPLAMLIPTTHGAQLAKYYLGLITIPDWQLVFGWAYLLGFTALMAFLAKRWARWVDP